MNVDLPNIYVIFFLFVYFCIEIACKIFRYAHTHTQTYVHTYNPHLHQDIKHIQHLRKLPCPKSVSTPQRNFSSLVYCHRLVLSVFTLQIHEHTTCTLFCPHFSTWCLPDLSVFLRKHKRILSLYSVVF